MTGLYIHYPFCRNLCFYCHFIKSKYNSEKNKRYINAIIKEIKKISKNGEIYDTVYFGGGTPSLLKENIYIIIEIITKYLNIDLKEVNIEVNPEDINERFIKILRKAEISRVSIGIQEIDNRLLRLLGRNHSVKEIYRGVEILKKEGFVLNFDFIVGIPTETEYEMEKIINFIKKYNPESVSIYFLENVRGKYWDKFTELDDKQKLKNFAIIEEFLESFGIKRYEISNFAKTGKESIHNLKYWNYEDFIGIGPSASSMFKKKRWKNSDSFVFWEEQILKNYNYKNEQYILTESDIAKEAVMMGLRKIEGINIKKFKKKFGINPLEILRDCLTNKREFFEIDENNIKIERKSLFIFNSLLSELF